MKIYLAGPLGFSEAGRRFLDQVLLPRLTRLGHIPVDPFSLTAKSQLRRANNLRSAEKRKSEWQRLNIVIARNNVAAIDACDAVFAILDGPDVDSGTAAEIGYAFAKRKPILGYRNDFRLSADNEGAKVNLQVEYFIRQSGGDIIEKVAEIGQALRKMRARL